MIYQVGNRHDAIKMIVNFILFFSSKVHPNKTHQNKIIIWVIKATDNHRVKSLRRVTLLIACFNISVWWEEIPDTESEDWSNSGCSKCELCDPGQDTEPFKTVLKFTIINDFEHYIKYKKMTPTEQTWLMLNLAIFI